LDPTGPEAESLAAFKQNAANAHAGEAAYIVTPSDVEQGNPLYSMTLKGIEGSGKQFDTQALITTRRKAIFNAFGAGNVIIGDSGSGSYALSESKNALHAHYIDALIRRILVPLNKDLIPQFLALNNIDLSQKDMISIVQGPVEVLDADTMSKVIQRVKAVNALPMTKDIIIEYMERLEFDVDHLRDMSEEEINETLAAVEDGESRSGDGMASGMSSGTGSSSGSSGDASTSNTEHDVSKAINTDESVLDKNGIVWLKEDLEELGKLDE